MEKIKTFHVETKNYINDSEEVIKYLKEAGIDEATIIQSAYVEITVDNEKRKATVVFKDAGYEIISKSIEDDWFAIMDCLHENKWLGKYEIWE